MKRLLCLLFFVTVALPARGPQPVPLPGVLKPDSIVLDDQRLYVVEGTLISIFHLEDHRLLRRIGQDGEGPGEFKVLPFLPLSVYLSGDRLVVNSFGKISIFTRSGDFIEETKVKGNTVIFIMPLGDRFCGQGVAQDGSTRYRTVSIYDRDLKKIRDLVRVPDDFKGVGRGYDVLEKRLRHQVLDGRLLITTGPEFVIDVVDVDGNHLSTITLDYERVPMNEAGRQALTEYLETAPRTKAFFALLKPLRFPSHFPAIMNLYTADGKLYVLTWKNIDQGRELLVFDKNGRLLNRTAVRVAFRDALEPAPMAILDGRLYQVVEDEESCRLTVQSIPGDR